MSCEACRDIFQIDEELPECYNNTCRIPEVDPQGKKVLFLRSLLLSLRDLVDPGTILRMYEATKEDIELMAELEAEIKQREPERGQ